MVCTQQMRVQPGMVSFLSLRSAWAGVQDAAEAAAHLHQTKRVVGRSGAGCSHCLQRLWSVSHPMFGSDVLVSKADTPWRFLGKGAAGWGNTLPGNRHRQTGGGRFWKARPAEMHGH